MHSQFLAKITSHVKSPWVRNIMSEKCPKRNVETTPYSNVKIGGYPFKTWYGCPLFWWSNKKRTSREKDHDEFVLRRVLQQLELVHAASCWVVPTAAETALDGQTTPSIQKEPLLHNVVEICFNIYCWAANYDQGIISHPIFVKLTPIIDCFN